MNITEDHWLELVKRDEIKGGNPMNTRRFLVIHFTGGASAKSSIESMREQGLSAHIVVDRDGTVYQCRPFNKQCAHAGKSKWTDPNTGKTYTGLNANSIGIEIANGGDDYPTKFSKLPPYVGAHKNGGPIKKWEQFPAEQIAAVAEVAKALIKRYNLDSVAGHDEIAPDRKTDPGPAFPWAAFRKAIGFYK